MPQRCSRIESEELCAVCSLHELCSVVRFRALHSVRLAVAAAPHSSISAIVLAWGHSPLYRHATAFRSAQNFRSASKLIDPTSRNLTLNTYRARMWCCALGYTTAVSHRAPSFARLLRADLDALDACACLVPSSGD